MKIVTIIGARPQFVKAAVLSRLIKNNENIREIILHTGQHYDKNMSEIFFEELNIPTPDYNLNIGSGTHGIQTGLMLQKIEEVLLHEKPDWVLVYGDTNSTIAGALAAAKLYIKIAHVEAGLRSFNRKMPEEINRIATDSISTLLFAPTKTALQNLENENLKEISILSGDIMLDSVLYYKSFLEKKIDLYNPYAKEDYYLSTIHRAENTDSVTNLSSIFDALSNTNKKVILPLHPRTKKLIKNIKFNNNIEIIEPVSYLKMLALIMKAKKVLTDSGGLQKEAYFLDTPCITMRNETEWIETIKGNWNIITGVNKEKILNALKIHPNRSIKKNKFGNGNASIIILNSLINKN